MAPRAEKAFAPPSGSRSHATTFSGMIPRVLSALVAATFLSSCDSSSSSGDEESLRLKVEIRNAGYLGLDSIVLRFRNPPQADCRFRVAAIAPDDTVLTSFDLQGCPLQGTFLDSAFTEHDTVGGSREFEGPISMAQYVCEIGEGSLDGPRFTTLRTLVED